jgi:hypothetical protein
MIVHADCENGILTNALLMFKSGRVSGGYHEINFDNHIVWFKRILIPNLPPNSVFVVDNAA